MIREDSIDEFVKYVLLKIIFYNSKKRSKKANQKIFFVTKVDFFIIVQNAETDPEKQFIVGKCLIEYHKDFPYNVELGIYYLELSIKNNYKDSIVYYIRILIKSDVIPQNHKKAKKLLEKYLKDDKSNYYLLYGKLYKVEKQYLNAIQCFQESIKIFLKCKGIEINEEESMNYITKAILNDYSPFRRRIFWSCSVS